MPDHDMNTAAERDHIHKDVAKNIQPQVDAQAKRKEEELKEYIAEGTQELEASGRFRVVAAGIGIEQAALLCSASGAPIRDAMRVSSIQIGRKKLACHVFAGTQSACSFMVIRRDRIAAGYGTTG